jgi:hypothetical protein
MVVKVLGWLDAVEAVEKAMGPDVARRCNAAFSKQEARDAWTLFDDNGHELARVENGGTLVSSGRHARLVQGEVQALRVLCPCGEPKVLIRRAMYAHRYECAGCGRTVMF